VAAHHRRPTMGICGHRHRGMTLVATGTFGYYSNTLFPVPVVGFQIS
jgi:hypothetical protein